MDEFNGNAATTGMFPHFSDDFEVQKSIVRLIIKVQIREQRRIEFIEGINRMESLLQAILLRAK